MCLLKPGQPNILCGHSECKNFYLMSKPLCMYSQSGSNLTPPAAKSSIADLLKLNQIPSLSLTSLSTSKGSPLTSNSSTQSLKRPASTSDTSLEDEAELAAQNKKVKLEGMEGNPKAMTLENLAQANMLLKNTSLNLFGNNVLPQQNYVANNQILINTQLENMLGGSQNNLLSMLQASQNTAPTIQNLQSLQLGLNAQNVMSMMPQNTLQNFSQSTPKETKQASNSFEQLLQELQAQTLTILGTQSRIIKDLSEKNDLVQDTLSCLISEVNTLKSSFQSTRGSEKVSKGNLGVSMKDKQAPVLGEVANSEDLLNYLYGPEATFDYQLALSDNLSLPLYRERNFEFSVQLTDNEGNIVENSNRICLALSLYSCENPPKHIDTNTAGNKIFKGFTEKNLVKGCASFEKIQIKEVSSHFRNGWVFLVIHPKLNEDGNSNVFVGKDGLVVDVNKIKPIILDKIIVKAKKMKEKEEGGETKVATEM